MDKVIQEDRDAADKAFDIAIRGEARGIDDAMAAAFAAHRERAEAAIVAWLRSGSHDLPDPMAFEVADAVARQAHRSAP